MKPSLLLIPILFCVFTAQVPKKEKLQQKPKYHLFKGMEEDKFRSVYWAEKIIPSEKYDYWAYVAEGMSFQFNESPHIVKERGDTAFRKHIKTTPPHYGFFVGCHPSSCTQFITVVKNKKVQYIDTCTGLRDFIGNIDNIEEALLYAESYGYHANGTSYKTYSNRYEFTASKTSCAPVIIIITRDGFIRVETIKNKHIN